MDCLRGALMDITGAKILSVATFCAVLDGEKAVG